MHNQIMHGIKANLNQIVQQLIQVFLVGLALGMTRTVVPGLAESEFGLAANAFMSLVMFVFVFGLVKASMNLVAGHLSEQYGRRRLLVVGWLLALPVPFLIYYAQSWSWIVWAMVFLGLNQGLCWSMALNSKLDLAKANQKGLINGLNEFSGYAAVGLAGWMTAYLAEVYGAREALLGFGLVVIGLGLVLAIWKVLDTRPWSNLHQRHYDNNQHNQSQNNQHHGDDGEKQTEQKQSLAQAFKIGTFQHKQLVALNQAGLVEKFIDALVWIFMPVYLISQTQTLVQASGIIAVYGVVWGASQLITGPASDKFGRRALIVGGFWLCAITSISFVWVDSMAAWSLLAAFMGFGMAMLYPTLGAAVADYSQPKQRASMLGVYRFWRDFGYAAGALLLGLLAFYTSSVVWPFYFVGAMMFLSGLWVYLALKPQKIV
ncbi:MFS transporter [Thiomicrospira cyclica]|uniref:Major facilitator superfamily MFS_1 n=1 Tax=Thiomicrospira cyclica (strain DSM 14477 / JCM 11371 / ALM1) TaxID=717773 RepID=F6D8Y6_THICA|nr:MFS transporter [Thiomicrospira cyclica]AEG31986.1 major facilitator superfamily MFS_1 [Thiomicrospira cyclica ALM1]